MVLAFFVFILILGLISAKAVRLNLYPHVCQNDWLQITLQGQDQAHTGNIATFSLVETGETLFTFTSNGPDPDQYEFKLVGLHSAAPSVLPSLGVVTSRNFNITGTCYNSTDTCATGYVWPFNGLDFVTSSNETTLVARSLYKNWAVGGVPSVIMYRRGPDGNRGERILQTTYVNPRDCAEQKVCVAQAARMSDGSVSPETLVQAGWILNQLALNAIPCTTGLV